VTSLALFFCIVRCRNVVKKRVLFVIYNVIAIEIVFQIFAFSGLLPGVNIYDHVPFGRVYWKQEGLGNSIMNRHGWHYPSLKLKPTSRKIVLLGDSFIQAVQLRPNQNIGVILQNIVNVGKAESDTTEVISLGLSGIGPAQYLELLKYASKYYDPDEAIIFVTLGNDFRNSYYKVQSDVSTRDYIYYQFDANNNLQIHPESVVAQKRFMRGLDANHYPVCYTFGKIAISHFMLRNVMQTIVTNVIRKQSQSQIVKQNVLRNSVKEKSEREIARENIQEELWLLGMDEFIFRKDSSREAKEAIAIVTGLLRMCKEYATSQGITLRVVTIPVVPGGFYAKYQSSNWSLESEDYDFLLPEKRLVDFAEKHKIPILPMGSYMYDNHLLPSQIKELYLTGGRGHFSENGHKYFAEALYDFFYSY
jgi:lysophospholipase L1-like esterase